MSCSYRTRCSAAAATVAFLLLACFVSSGFSIQEQIDFHRRLLGGAVSSRKFLLKEDEGVLKNKNRVHRIGEECSKDDIVLHQGETAPMPSGIPTFTVNILNLCACVCEMANIHLSCGWFSSARLVNPRVFRRLAYDDCLLNDGRPLPPGSSISFQYANSHHYPLSISNATCVVPVP